MPNTDVVQRYWNKNASEFDSLYESGTPFHRAFNAVFRKALFERIRLAAERIDRVEGATVLDVGCGSGRTTIPLAQSRTAKVTGIDFAPEMIALARKAAVAAQVDDRCTFVVGDFNTESAGGPFDFVTALGVLDYVDEPVPFVRRMLQLAKRELIFSVPKPSLVRSNLRKLRYGRHGVTVHFHTAEECRRIGQDAGAKTTTVLAIPAGYFVTCSPA